MGMFDDLLIEGDLHPDVSAGSRWQTKSLECDMDNYKLDASGQLWREEYDVEDRSDPNAEGIERLAGICTRVNERWVKSNWTGELYFYNRVPDKGWVECKAIIVRGSLDGGVEVAIAGKGV
ncbi:MAG: hypothetical protein M0Z39_11215 [Actinomycetota bacterium]|nr:hypothetical protein [Actinomycetota bacterium]